MAEFNEQCIEALPTPITHNVDYVANTKNILKKEYSLKVLNINIRSIGKNFDELILFLHDIDIEFDVLILTECWLSSNPVPQFLEGYNYYATTHHRNRAEGVVAFVKPCHQPRVTELDVVDANCLHIELQNSTNILAIYRSPSQLSVTSFIVSLDKELRKSYKYRNSIILGDLNINTIGNRHPSCDDYLCMLAQNGYVNGISVPTRATVQALSCLDHIHVRSKCEFETAVVKSTFTDHYSTVLGIIGHGHRNLSQNTYVRTDVNKIKSKLLLHDWSKLLHLTDVNEAVDLFYDTVYNIVDTYTTKVMVNHKHSKRKSWITNALVSCIHKRDHLHRQTVKHKSNMTLLDYYKKYRNTCNRAIKDAKTRFYKSQIESDNNNIKTVWRVVKEINNIGKPKSTNIDSLTYENQTFTEKIDIANSLNKHFVGIGRKLANNLLTGMHKREQDLIDKFSLVEHTDADHIFAIGDITTDEIKNCIKNLRKTASKGPDGLDARFLNSVCDEIAAPLAHIYSLSIRTGTFPTRLKEASVVPIFKDGDMTDPNNYRPISLLNVLSKILEQCINSRLTKFLETTGFYSDRQFGFRKGRGTHDALKTINDYITEHIDANDKCLAVFLDISKAFDSISQDLLLKKMNKIGIRDEILNWFSSYLKDRKQTVKINSTISDPMTISFGVPQGSTLGPTLFLIYINDLTKLGIDGTVVTFADDTALLLHDQNWQDLANKTNTSLQTVKTWLNDNLLTLNTRKTKYITFSIDHRQQPTDQIITIHDCTDSRPCECKPLESTYTIKYLGVHIDCFRRWNVHIDLLAKKVRQLIYIFKNIRNVLDPRTIMTIYYGLAQSIITYGILTWGAAARTIVDPLIGAQKALIRVINKKPCRYPTDLLLTDFPVLDIRKLFIRTMLTDYNKNKNKSMPVHYTHRTRARERGDALLTTARTTYGHRHHAFLAPKVYNALTSDLPEIKQTTEASFKVLVTRWLLDKHRSETESMVSAPYVS